MSVFAYCRVSTNLQSSENQQQAIEKVEMRVVEWFHEEGVSGSIPALERPEFARMMAKAVAGDTVIVTMIDRIGRDASDVLNTINTFKERGIKLRVTQLDGTDVTSPTGRMCILILSGLAEMEKAILIERTNQGIATAKSAGVKFGPPKKLTPEVLEKVIADKHRGYTLDEMSTKHSLHRNTLQKAIVKWSGRVAEYAEEFKAQQRQHLGEKSVMRKLQ